MQEINGDRDGVSLPLGIGLYRCPAHSHEPHVWADSWPPDQVTDRKDTSKGGKCTEAGRAGERVTMEVTITGEPSLPLCSVLEA